MNKKPKTLILFYVLVAYILLQFGWWAFLLTSLTSEVFLNKEAELSSKYLANDVPVSEIEFIKKKQQSRIAMILGEGSVFILLLAIGIYRVKKSLEKETALARQQKNFMLSVTHELKTPLAAIKLNLQTIQKRKLEKISVVLELKNGKVFLEIRDLGPGIPTNEKENIFNKFYRIGNEETRKTKGTGLGLFISKYIADKQGIKISVHENKPSGSVFRLIFLDLK